MRRGTGPARCSTFSRAHRSPEASVPRLSACRCNGSIAPMPTFAAFAGLIASGTVEVGDTSSSSRPAYAHCRADRDAGGRSRPRAVEGQSVTLVLADESMSRAARSSRRQTPPRRDRPLCRAPFLGRRDALVAGGDAAGRRSARRRSTRSSSASPGESIPRPACCRTRTRFHERHRRRDSEPRSRGRRRPAMRAAGTRQLDPDQPRDRGHVSARSRHGLTGR